MRSNKLRNDDDEQQLSLQPLLELNDPGYNYDDYDYDIDEDEEGYDDSYQEYKSEILNSNDKKPNNFGISKKLLPDKNSFKQNPLSPEHHSSFHPNSSSICFLNSSASSKYFEQVSHLNVIVLQHFLCIIRKI